MLVHIWNVQWLRRRLGGDTLENYIYGNVLRETITTAVIQWKFIKQTPQKVYMHAAQMWATKTDIFPLFEWESSIKKMVRTRCNIHANDDFKWAHANCYGSPLRLKCNLLTHTYSHQLERQTRGMNHFKGMN